MKAYKNIGFGPQKSKKGFTLIELLIVLVILAILAGVVVMAVGGVFGTSREGAYNTTQEELKNAVAQYASNNMGNLPNESAFADVIVDGDGVVLCNGSAGACDIIDIDLLLVSVDGILGKAPDSCADDNGTACTASSEAGSYIWVMDQYGNVFSACTGGDCPAAAMNGSDYVDGYQDPAYP